MNELALVVLAPMDVAIPIETRVDLFMDLCEHTAEAIIAREEEQNPDVPWLPQPEDTPEDMQRRGVLRKQEAARREMRIISELGQIANLLELRCAMKYQAEAWMGPDGEATTLLEELEHQMPGEEERASSGKARQVWSFLKTANIFKEHGITDEEISRCNIQGKRVYLALVAVAQRKISETEENEEERTDKFHKIIATAESSPNSYKLRRDLALVVGDDGEQATVPFTLENDDGNVWLIIRLPGDATYLVMDRLRDVLEPSVESLAELFCQFWKSQ